MPEGDTLHRTATRLRPALVGRPVVRFAAPRLVGEVPRVGTVIAVVESVGKHLLVRFDGGLVLETHLRMTGSWHLYRVGERWQRGAHLARVELEVPEWVAVCFSAPVVRTWRGGADEPTLRLGPDLCRPDADLDVALHRMADLPDPAADIADVLLDQRVVSGIGNVFKSEVLWACHLDPFAPLAAVDLATRRQLLVTAAAQLRANLGSGPRSTLPGGGLAVYGRHKRPCPRCTTLVRMVHRGEHARSTYWCPSCQPAAGPDPAH
jgi:endonuclease-8